MLVYIFAHWSEILVTNYPFPCFGPIILMFEKKKDIGSASTRLPFLLLFLSMVSQRLSVVDCVLLLSSPSSRYSSHLISSENIQKEVSELVMSSGLLIFKRANVFSNTHHDWQGIMQSPQLLEEAETQVIVSGVILFLGFGVWRSGFDVAIPLAMDGTSCQTFATGSRFCCYLHILKQSLI